jgi:TRAP-type C4-dicarboxylate transport system substrate-binding protein
MNHRIFLTLLTAAGLSLSAAGAHAAAPAAATAAPTAAPAASGGNGLPVIEKGRVGLPPPLPKPVNVRFCIFDPMGPQGKITQTAIDLAKAAKDWNFIVDIRTYTDERVATEDFKAGQCDGVAISTLRAKQFNFTVGSIDAPGNLRNYDEMKTLMQMLANPVVASLAINGKYQVAAIVPIGSIFVVVNDRNINSIEKAAGKRVVVLDWDPTQAKMISGIGAMPVPADFATYAGKFNNGQADIIAAPAMGFKPMELYKGVGKNGGVIRFPLLQATASILIRRDLILPKIPDLDTRLNQVRQFGLQYVDAVFTMLKESESDIPKKLWIDLAKPDQDKYYRMLREARLNLTRNGVYDPVMMSLMKRVRCKHVPTDAECGAFDE